MRKILMTCLLGVSLFVSAFCAVPTEAFAQHKRRAHMEADIRKIVNLAVMRGLGKEHVDRIVQHLLLTIDKTAGDPQWVRSAADTYVPILVAHLNTLEGREYHTAAKMSLMYREVYQKQPSSELLALVDDYMSGCDVEATTKMLDQEGPCSADGPVHTAFEKEYPGSFAGMESYLILQVMAWPDTEELRDAFRYAFATYYDAMEKLLKKK